MSDRIDIAALCDEVERLRASNERLRHVVGLDEAIYMDLARSAGFDHEPPSDARQCIAAVHALAAERDALRAIIAGRTTAPTAAEVAAHDAAGGWWRYQTENDWGDATCQDVGLIREAWAITRWWALDASGAPCVWPVVTKEVR